uniref:Putative ovule protein n=1 Tax=Solanum chacoense TaxID=4108 RepID=A0A0V0GVC7_SOLCH
MLKIFKHVLGLLIYHKFLLKGAHLLGGMGEPEKMVYLRGWTESFKIQKFRGYFLSLRWSTFPLLCCENKVNKVRKSFKFLKFWVEHKSFLDVVKKN